MASAKQLLTEGLTDAACFLAGTLAGYGLGRLVGIDIFAEGYGGSSLIGILMVGLGGGAGLHIARLWRGHQRHKALLAQADAD